MPLRTPPSGTAAPSDTWTRVVVAVGAVLVTALLGAGLSMSVVQAAAATGTAPAGDETRTGAAVLARRANHPSRERSRMPPTSTSTTTPSVTTTAARPAPTTTTTIAPPAPPPAPPAPPPPAMFGTTEERQHVLFVTGQGWGNGDIPQHGLAEVVPGCRLIVPAAPRFHRLLLEAAWAGHHFRINDCYRDLQGQHVMRWEWCERGSCANAAVPGYSSHGSGVAVDLGLPDRQLLPTDAAYAWLAEHGGRFGFRQPDWARPDGPLPEPWHWEYYGPVDRTW